MKDTLRVVPLHPHTKPTIANLHQGLVNLIEEYIDFHGEDKAITLAEVIGTLKFVEISIIKNFGGDV